MATTKETKADDSAHYDPAQPCPACKEIVHMYVPPDRGIGGSIAYPALLIHFEEKHKGIVPPLPPLVDEIVVDELTGLSKRTGKKVADTWTPEPPAPDAWQALDKDAAKKQRPQPAGVWPPLREIEQPV